MHLMMTGLLLPVVFVTSSFFHLTFYWAQVVTPFAEALQGISALSPLSPLTGLSAAGQDPWMPGKPPCQEEHGGCAGPALAGATGSSEGLPFSKDEQNPLLLLGVVPALGQLPDG